MYGGVLADGEDTSMLLSNSYITINKVPAVISTTPINIFKLTCSLRITNESISVMTILNLSIDATFAVEPNCNAL